jgi:hypothetical protein
MLIKNPADIKSSEITDNALYLRRRELLKTAALVAGVALAPGLLLPRQLRQASSSSMSARRDPRLRWSG